MNIQNLFQQLPPYNESLFDKVKRFLGFAKQRRWEQDTLVAGFVASHSGRSLRMVRPWHVNWEVLRRISQVQPVVFSIIGVAVRELSGMQWDIVVKRGRAGVMKKAAEIKEFLSRPVPSAEGLTFAEWLKKILRDLFTYDAVAIEVVRDEKNRVVALKPIPAWQIEMYAVPETDDLDPEFPYIRVLRGQVIAKYKPSELIYFKENTRTDSPYGISPLEAAITIVSIIMWADAFQLRNLTVTEVPEGILDLGNVPHDEVERFRQWWLTNVVGKPEKVVIVGGSPTGVKWTPFRQDNRAMQFRQLYDWYVRILCMCFGVRPQDVGLIEGLNRAVAQELAIGGKRVSLYPRAVLLREVINHDILEELFDIDLADMEFKWLDLERRDLEQSARIIRTLGTTYMTINEAREMLGLDRAVGGLADALFWQAGAMAFVIGKVPKEGEDINELIETEVNTVGVWTGAPPPTPTEGSPLAGLFMTQKYPPLEKIITAVRTRVKKLPTYWERGAAWEKVAVHQINKRIPVSSVTVTLNGKEPTTGNDYETILEKLSLAETRNPTIWSDVEQAIAETDARRATVNVENDKVTIILAGRHVEKELVFDLSGE